VKLNNLRYGEDYKKSIIVCQCTIAPTQFHKGNTRPQPQVYAEIRKVNAGLLEVDEEEQDVMDLGKNECAASMHR
jgi:hypothetical protein